MSTDDDRDHLPTTPLPWLDASEPLSDPAVPASAAAAPAAPADPAAPPTVPAAPAAPPTVPPAGMAVTDGMKAADPQSGPSFVRRHALGLGVAAAVLAVVVVAGGTAWGVSAAVAANNTAVPAVMNPVSHAKKGGAKAGAHSHTKGVVGTVTALSAGTWTVRSASGAAITVTVGPSTSFGTPKKPATASSFAVGDRVAVLGTRDGDSVTATRIVHLAAAHSHSTAPTGTPTSAATT